MAKRKNALQYACSSCGEVFPRWSGRCPACETWNTLEEMDAPALPAAPERGAPRLEALQPLSALPQVAEARIQTGVRDLDLVLGGGLVLGSFVLIAGEPGIGKSTLFFEMARNFPGAFYYFTGEESVQQSALRARRLGLSGESLFISRETDLDAIVTRILREKPAVAVIDSIQTVSSPGRESPPGSSAQLKSTAMFLLEAAKSSGTPVVVSGHITKDGAVAGPRLLEHMVDAVLYFESDRLNQFRMLRAIKNRFGPVGEAAFFQMSNAGLAPIQSPGAVSAADSGPGRVCSAITEGSRALAVEVQSLVTRAPFGPARRMAEGLDTRRVILLAAVLEKLLKVRLAECDIFANLAGGLNADEPALDLAICAAILSSYREAPIPSGMAFFGEVGLSGEVRAVSRSGDRALELARLGFRRLVIPAGSTLDAPPGIELIEITAIYELARLLGGQESAAV